jgi:hypothetical protein
LKLNGKQKLPVHAGDVNILGGSFHNLNKNIEPLLLGSQDVGLYVNAEIAKYMVVSPDEITT